MADEKKPEPIIKSIPKGRIPDFDDFTWFDSSHSSGLPSSSQHLDSDSPPFFNKDLSGFPTSDLSGLRGSPIPLDGLIDNLTSVSNQAQSGQEKWRALFDIQGNTAPADAKLTYLCETSHKNEIAAISIAQYLTEIPKSGDIVLAEGFPAGLDVDRSIAESYGKLPEGVIVRGWDNMELFEEGKKLYDELDRINAELQSPQIPEEEKRTLRIYKSGELLPRIQQVVIKGRNQSLMQAIDTIRENNADTRIFVWVGVDHIDKDPDLIEYSEKFPYTVLRAKT